MISNLIERVERASADEQGEMILLALKAILLSEGHAPDSLDAHRRVDRMTELMSVDAYESAALTLVPEGYAVDVRIYWADDDRKPYAAVWDSRDPPHQCHAATPALALVAASLRAIDEEKN